MRKSLVSLVILYFMIAISPVFAYEMASPNYRIQTDSINMGGILATTTNYQIAETIGEIAADVSETTNYKLKAGYQQMQEVYIAISVPAAVTLAPNIKNLSGGQSSGSGAITVTTDSPSGYLLSIKASSAPVLTGAGDSFADYTPQIVGTPDFTWSVAANSSEFGFTPESSHLLQKFKDNGLTCNLGANDTVNACWYNLSTTDQSLAQSYAGNHPSGTITTVKFRAEVGASRGQTAGNYQAVITFTAVAN